MGFLQDRLDSVQAGLKSAKYQYSKMMARVMNKSYIDDTLAIHVIDTFGYKQIYEKEKKRLNQE